MRIKLVKLGAVLALSCGLLYAGVVAAFEAGLLMMQPTWKGTLVLTTTDEERNPRERVIVGLYYDGNLYVRANHWPRQWYYEALANPAVLVDRGSGPAPFVAVPVDDAEAAQVNARNGIPLKWRILTGFPPLRLLRLEKAEAGVGA